MKNPFKKNAAPATACTAQTRSSGGWYGSGWSLSDPAEVHLYRQARQALPILDAAILKLVRLTGGFTAVTGNDVSDRALERFLGSVNCGRGQRGIDAFLTAYLDSLLMYGRAVGEMVVREGELEAVLWGDVTKICVMDEADPLNLRLGCFDGTGVPRELPYQNLLLFTTLNPEPEHPYGVSLLRGLPYFAELLGKIYRTIGSNWERAGDVRYSVICRPDADGQAEQQAEAVAREWSKAMSGRSGGQISDFVAVGDVQIKAIGADGQILDSEVPVRQLLEQVVAKTGLPPFLLGLSWSSTERMSKQQADLLTSELWALRRTVQPAIERICQLYLHLNGLAGHARVQWEEISLQDSLEEAHAQLYRAQARQLEQKVKG